MTRIILIILAAAGLCAQPNCTSPVVDDVGPTWARIRATVDQSISYTRVVYGGVTVGSEQATHPAGFVYATIGGLTPSTSYSATLQASSNGSSWCTGSAVTVNTTAATSWEPAAPTAVSPDPRTTPATTGTTRTAVTCADIQTMLADSVPGDKLVIPAALTCSQSDWTGGSLTFGLTDAQLNARGWYKLTAMDAAANTFTRNSHGLTNGTLIRFAWWATYGRSPRGIDAAVDYYVVGATANTFQVSLTAGGAAVDVVDVPFSNPMEVIYQAGAVPSGEILIVGSNDASLPPAGVTVAPGDRTLMPTLRGTRSDIVPMFDFRMAPSPIRIRGIRFLSDAPATSGQADPPAFGQFILNTSSSRRMTIERNIFEQTAAYPQRTKLAAVQLDGVNTAAVDNYASLQFWRPWNKSVNPSASGGVLTIAAGDYYLGHKRCSTSTATATITSGSPGGTARFWLDTNCAITVQVPTGYAGNCSGCTLTTAASPAYPETSNSYTAWPIGQAGMSTGFDWTLKAQIYELAKGGGTLGATESGSVFNATRGPGPTLVDNNHIVDSPGVTIFHDGLHYDNAIGLVCDGETTCGSIQVGDWTVTRNRVTYSDAVRQPDESSQTLRVYSHRNAIEAKDCRRCRIAGNTVTGNYRSINAGPAIALTPLTVGKTETQPSQVTIRDVAVEDNYLHGASGINITGRYPGPTDVGIPSARIAIRRNLILTDSSLSTPSVSATSWGAMYLGHGPQLLTVERNTMASTNSPGNWAQPACVPATMNHTRNILLANNFTGYGGGALWQQCFGTAGSSPLNVNRTAGAVWSDGGIVGTFGTDNVMIGGSADGGELSEANTTTLASSFTSAIWPSGETVAARRTAAGLLSDWSHRLGAAQRTAGADVASLQAARGAIFGAWQASATSDSVTIAIAAPDAWQCYARPSSGAAWTRAAGSTARQTITLTGLSAATAYVAEIACASERRTLPVRTQ